MSPYRGGCPVGTMLAVGQSLAVSADVAELTSGPAVEAPPDAYRHAVLESYHGFAHIVHLVAIAHFAVLDELLVEVCEMSEVAGQLMGVAPFIPLLAAGVPVEGLIVVEGVGTHDGDAVEAWLLAQQFGYLYLLGVGGSLLH